MKSQVDRAFSIVTSRRNRDDGRRLPPARIEDKRGSSRDHWSEALRQQGFVRCRASPSSGQEHAFEMRGPTIPARMNPSTIIRRRKAEPGHPTPKNPHRPGILAPVLFAVHRPSSKRLVPHQPPQSVYFQLSCGMRQPRQDEMVESRGAHRGGPLAAAGQSLSRGVIDIDQTSRPCPASDEFQRSMASSASF